MGHLVDHSRGDPLHVEIPYNSVGCAQDGLRTAAPPQQKELYCPQVTHRDKLYFSSLSCSDFGVLSCPTAAVSEKTRRAPTYLETIPHNLEVEKKKELKHLGFGSWYKFSAWSTCLC